MKTTKHGSGAGTPLTFLAAACLGLLAACGADDGSDTGIAPATPASVASVDSDTEGQISITWSESGGADSYHVKRSISSDGPFTPIAVSTSNTITDGELTDGTSYYYVVSATNAKGESADSTPMRASAKAATAPPLAPGNVTAIAGDARASLTWSASNGAKSYKIKRSVGNGVPYRQVGTSTSTSYTSTGMVNGTAYYFVVSAVNSAGESADSAFVSATPAAATVVPQPPNNLTATPGNTQIILSWSASSGAASYNVKRSTSGGPYTVVASRTTTSYTDASLPNGTAQYYVVTADNTAGESAQSAQVSATPQAPATVPAAPANVSATSGNAQVTLNWSASSGATSYNVKRSDDGGASYSVAAQRTTNSYADAGLTNGKTYYYTLTAVNAAGESGNSGVVGGTPVAPTVVPSAPSNVMASSGNAQVNLSWVASNGATSYKVKRSTSSGGPFTSIATPTSTSYTNTALTNGTAYYYVVSAVNSAGESGNSAQASATPSGGATVSYSTSFDANEAPLSEGGKWKHNNVYFRNVVTNGGIAYGTSPIPMNPGQYEDSYAFLGGMGFPANQYASAHIHKGATNSYMEVELLLRWSDTSNSTQGYECYLHQGGEYVTITRWTGGALSAPASIAYFDEIARVTNTLVPNDGDLYEASIVGNIITVKLRGVTLISADVSSGGRTPIASGNPGIGFDTGGTGDEPPSQNYSVSDYSATGL